MGQKICGHIKPIIMNIQNKNDSLLLCEKKKPFPKCKVKDINKKRSIIQTDRGYFAFIKKCWL